MSFFLQLMYQLLTLKDHKKLFIHCIHRTYFGQKFKIQFGKNHQNQNNYPNYPIMFLYSNVTQNNELEMESLSEYAHHAGLLLLGSDSPRSACLKSNTQSLIQSSFYLPPLKISVKNCIWDTWSVWLECRHGKHEKKSRGQLITHPLMFQCHEQRRTCLCTAAFLVLAERKIPISRTESIWIYLLKFYDNVFKNWVQIRYERNINVINFPNSSQRQIAYHCC